MKNNPIKVNQLEPLADRIFVLPDEDNNIQSGIIIPDNAKEKAQIGTVISVGIGTHATLLGDFDAKKDLIDKMGEQAFTFFQTLIESLVLVKTELIPGDRILFGKYAGQEIEIDGKKYLVMRESDVISRVKE